MFDRKQYVRDYQREWMRKRRLDYFKDKLCSKCGSIENLELHHVDRFTKVSHSIWSWSEKRRIEELEKCDILCETCHQSETNVQIKEWASKPVPHGSQSGYRRGCRCDRCLEAYRIARRKHYLVTGN